MLVLHSLPNSAALPVRILLEDLGLPYRQRRVEHGSDVLSSPAYRALHPLGKIPALETPQGTMFETAAILLWLADSHAPGRLAPPPDGADRGAFLKWLFFATSNLHPAVLAMFYPDRTAGPEAADAVTRHAALRAAEALAALEAGAGAAPAVFPADRPSVLGLYIGTLMRWLGQLPEGHPGQTDAARYPALSACLAASESADAALRVAAEEGLGPTLFTRPAR